MITLYNMDVMKALKQMPSESVDMQITSPPYWGLRDYGVEGQIGLEPDFNDYIKRMCDIFDEVKRVLKKDGTCWINLGDTYFGGGGGNYGKELNKTDTGQYVTNFMNKMDYYTAKCLICIPERFALEMINRGWILRNKIIWHKSNHMPTSVKDRFANSWEYLFMFSKSKHYYFDLDTVREPHTNISKERIEAGFKEGSAFDYTKRNKRGREYDGRWGDDGKGMAMPEKWCNPKGKNPDDCWDITTQPYKEAHFAVFPEKLVERPIKTTRKKGIILDIFAGSGTTLKVARDLHRNVIGIEIKKEYCDLIYKRLFGNNKQLINNFKLIKGG